MVYVSSVIYRLLQWNFAIFLEKDDHDDGSDNQNRMRNDYDYFITNQIQVLISFSFQHGSVG